MTSNIAIVSQARIASERLPGKVMKQINGKTLLQYHVERLYSSKIPVIVATTVSTPDDRIIEELDRLNIPGFRSSEQDVLYRYYETACAYDLDVIIRVTSDCPLIDGELIQKGLELYLKSPNPERTYLSNCLQRTFPRGFDFEIFSRTLLEEAHDKARLAFEREHVTPYFYYQPKADIQLINVAHSFDKSNYRVTVDTVEDFELVQILIQEGASRMSFQQIIQLLEEHPHWAELNAQIKQKQL
jgi:spore coat polysaccharide biosynthesis protein SpsF